MLSLFLASSLAIAIKQASVPLKAPKQNVGVPQPPTFPSQYFVQGTFSIPYFQTEEVITAWTDVANDMQKIEYYGGMDTYLYRYDQGMAYEVVPIMQAFGCFSSNSSGPMLGQQRRDVPNEPQVLPLVPDISTWTYNSSSVIRGIKCTGFSTEVVNMTAYGTGKSYYTMWVDDNNHPIQLQMMGINFIMGSHPDIYVFDYHVFHSNVSASHFDVPAMCTMENRATTDVLQRRSAHRVNAIHQSLGRVVPPMHTYMDCAHDVHPEFHAFTLKHMKRYSSCAEHEHRQTQYFSNKDFVAQWNGDKSHTHTVELNRFADLSDEEYGTVVLMPKNERVTQRRRAGLAAAHHAHVAPAGFVLPTSVDWRLKNAVTPVKDQGACGSCWAFGSAGSLEGVWAIKKSQLISLSEQNINDCSWPQGQTACDGGEAPGAYQTLMNAGGMGTEQSYPYLAQDGWCNLNDHSSGVVVSNYVNVTGVQSLQNAVAQQPVAIAIDASLPSLRFYKSGTYDDPACKNGVNDLDHEVLAVGYGVDASNVTYLIVKNSWSTWWGNDGYVNLKLDGNVCGASTAATYPMV